ncbi:MAG: hydantoinase B/oxoprolinase family protein, partial [Alphaproteobacteria bacterium]|nr:hydantoinase B/oxoprolinase family protein [Alphaproteobacteria bacterium]
MTAQATRTEFDPARLEMLWNRLQSIADEMAVALTRTAFSPIVRDAHDYGCSIFDANANMVAITNNCTPGLAISAMVSVKKMLEHYEPHTLKPGDVLITNHPWLATGHLLDLTIVTPVFHSGKLAGYAAAVAHHMDIGGRKTTPDTTEVYEEGLFLPVLKLYEEGRANDTLLRILASNVRVPEMVVGDVHAQVAANGIGGRRIADLLDENGWDDLNEVSVEVLRRAEAAMRGAIARIPDGEYRSEMILDGFETDLKIVTTIRIAGDELTVDFAGTSPQVNRGINCVLPITQGITLIAIQTALGVRVPTNSGLVRPLTITAPEGSLLCARYPAPVVARSLVLDHIPPAVFTALAKAVPDRVCAPNGGPIWGTRFYGQHPSGKSFFVIELLNSGMGARASQDGVSALSFPNNVATVPIEIFEAGGAPVFVERKNLIHDSGGPGRFRGGLGQEFRVRVLPNEAWDITVSHRADRTRNPAPGLFGGAPGRRGELMKNDSERIHPKRPTAVAAGDVISWQLPGGGGYGDPLTRDPARVRDDVIAGWVSRDAAASAYGVVLE